MLVTDFRAPADPGWYVVNDDVMGGRSEGGVRLEDGRIEAVRSDAGVSRRRDG